MKIIVNGQEKEFEQPLNMEDIANCFCKDMVPVIAEINGAIIRNSQWRYTSVQDGDRIELLRFVGGG